MMEDFNLLATCAGLGAPFADLAAAPNATPSTMIGAMRFLLRDTKESRALKKRTLRSSRGARWTGRRFEEDPGRRRRPVQEPADAVQQDRRAPLRGIDAARRLAAAQHPGRAGYAVLRERGYGHLPIHLTPDRPSSFVLGGAPRLTPASPTSPAAALPAAARRDGGSFRLRWRRCSPLHAEGELLGFLPACSTAAPALASPTLPSATARGTSRSR